MEAGRKRLPLLVALTLVWPVRAADRQGPELRLGYFPNITHAQALYARATGAFEKAGVRINWIAFNAGPGAMESLLTDAVDATFVGPSPTINAYIKSRGEKFVIIAGSASGGAGMVVRRDAGITSDKDFANKVIATPQLGNTQDIAARAWLAMKGYRLRERGGNVSLVALSNPDQLNMFKKKQIDGAWTVEPWLSRLEVEGGGQMFLEEKELWPGGRYITTHLVMNKSYLAGNRTIVSNLLAALVDATQQLNTDRTNAITVLNRQLKKETGRALQALVIERALSRVELTWDPVCASLKSSAEASYRAGFLRARPALEGIYSLSLLDEVLKEKNLPPIEGQTPSR
jgi:NitT/TauT family transport system substrate-binding protein